MRVSTLCVSLVLSSASIQALPTNNVPPSEGAFVEPEGNSAYACAKGSFMCLNLCSGKMSSLGGCDAAICGCPATVTETEVFTPQAKNRTFSSLVLNERPGTVHLDAENERRAEEAMPLEYPRNSTGSGRRISWGILPVCAKGTAMCDPVCSGEQDRVAGCDAKACGCATENGDRRHSTPSGSAWEESDDEDDSDSGDESNNGKRAENAVEFLPQPVDDSEPTNTTSTCTKDSSMCHTICAGATILIKGCNPLDCECKFRFNTPHAIPLAGSADPPASAPQSAPTELAKRSMPVFSWGLLPVCAQGTEMCNGVCSGTGEQVGACDAKACKCDSAASGQPRRRSEKRRLRFGPGPVELPYGPGSVILP